MFKIAAESLDVFLGALVGAGSSVGGGALEDASGTAGATMAGEFCGIGGKFMGVLGFKPFKNPRAPTTIAYTNHTETEIITTGGANTANAVRQREILCSAARADTIATAIHTKLINEK